MILKPQQQQHLALWRCDPIINRETLNLSRSIVRPIIKIRNVLAVVLSDLLQVSRQIIAREFRIPGKNTGTEDCWRYCLITCINNTIIENTIVSSAMRTTHFATHFATLVPRSGRSNHSQWMRLCLKIQCRGGRLSFYTKGRVFSRSVVSVYG